MGERLLKKFKFDGIVVLLGVKGRNGILKFVVVFNVINKVLRFVVIDIVEFNGGDNLVEEFDGLSNFKKLKFKCLGFGFG